MKLAGHALTILQFLTTRMSVIAVDDKMRKKVLQRVEQQQVEEEIGIIHCSVVDQQKEVETKRPVRML